MTTATDLKRKADVKRRLAEKYASLAKVTKSQPKRQTYLYRVDRYARQAEVITRQIGS
ncbi:MAG: hypothetical protein KY475_25050 [Planctomycetes bacterium]|nr:hypothetical protein [Planctomycetota bacterium]